MVLRLVRSVAAPAAIAVGILVLGAASAPAKGDNGLRSSRPRLVVSPSKLRAAQAIAPGDRIERLAELRRRGRGRFAAVYFRVRARTGSGLASGLQVSIDRCSRKWRRGGARYRCPG